MADTTIPLHKIHFDDAGRVVIDDQELADKVRSAQAQTDDDPKTGNIVVPDNNTACANVLAKCLMD